MVVNGVRFEAQSQGSRTAVESVPGRVGGAWVFRGTRLAVATVMENLQDLAIDEVMEQFDVRREQINWFHEMVAREIALPGHSKSRKHRHARQLRGSANLLSTLALARGGVTELRRNADVGYQISLFVPRSSSLLVLRG